MSFTERHASTAAPGGGPIAIQPGRPDNEVYAHDLPHLLVVDPQGDAKCNVLQRGRKITLRGTWTIRQYRAKDVPCGARFTLNPGPDATYTWEVLD